MKTLTKLSAVTYMVLSAGCASAPHDLVTAVPLGSRLSDLDKYIQRGPGSEGEVTGQFTRDSSAPLTIHLREASYDRWSATAKERDTFTGIITFTDYGTTSADVNDFTYKEGRLVDKDWGFLPG